MGRRRPILAVVTVWRRKRSCSRVVVLASTMGCEPSSRTTFSGFEMTGWREQSSVMLLPNRIAENQDIRQAKGSPRHCRAMKTM